MLCIQGKTLQCEGDLIFAQQLELSSFLGNFKVPDEAGYLRFVYFKAIKCLGVELQ